MHNIFAMLFLLVFWIFFWSLGLFHIFMIGYLADLGIQYFLVSRAINWRKYNINFITRFFLKYFVVYINIWIAGNTKEANVSHTWMPREVWNEINAKRNGMQSLSVPSKISFQVKSLRKMQKVFRLLMLGII